MHDASVSPSGRLFVALITLYWPLSGECTQVSSKALKGTYRNVANEGNKFKYGHVDRLSHKPLFYHSMIVTVIVQNPEDGTVHDETVSSFQS